MPSHWLGKVRVEQTVGAFQMAHEQSDDWADHCEAFATLEQCGNKATEGDTDLDQLVTHPLQHLQRAHYVAWNMPAVMS
jgi:hypothetical protein